MGVISRAHSEPFLSMQKVNPSRVLDCLDSASTRRATTSGMVPGDSAAASMIFSSWRTCRELSPAGSAWNLRTCRITSALPAKLE